MEYVFEAHAWTPCARFLAHTLAIVIVVLGVMCAIAGFVILVISSVLSLQEHWSVYRKGAQNFAEGLEKLAVRVSGEVPKELVDEFASSALERAEALVSAVATALLGSIHRCVLEFVMMAMYMSFWLTDPIPIGNAMQELFKRYIMLKTVACFGYGSCVGAVLWALNVDLAVPFGFASFFLSFIPEVGAFVALLLPAPVILFDSRLQSPVLTFVTATMAQLGLKFFFANVVEVKLVEADELMKMHPVIVLLAVAFFGYIWGPTGMLLSVPLVAYLKVAVLSEHIPARYRDPVLVAIEGDQYAPKRYEAKWRPALATAGTGAGSTASAVLATGPLPLRSDEDEPLSGAAGHTGAGSERAGSVPVAMLAPEALL